MVFYLNHAKSMILASALAFSVASFAQGFPAKPIKLVVPQAQSGLPDVLARMLAQGLSGEIGQPVVVDNRPGGNTIIGMQLVAKAAPDGYTLLLSTTNSYAITPAVVPKLPYDPINDFAAITQAVRGPLFLVVNSDLGVGSVQELVALARSKPGLINYGSPGNASLHQLCMESLKLMAKVDLTHIPYKGAIQAIPALLSNEISAMFIAYDAAAPHLKSGRLRAIAVSTGRRSTLSKDVPTIAESGLSGFDIASIIGVSAPAGTPRLIIDRLFTSISRTLKNPEMESRLGQNLGMEVVASTPEQYTERMVTDRAYFARLAKDINLKID